MSELNNYTPTPVTREEKILSGADIQPRTRMEYFLKMASENGGGNVPAPTAGDVGKVLLVNSEGQLVLDYPPRDTPVPTPEDAGSVITVNEFGAYVLGEGGVGLPSYTSADNGKVLALGEDGGSVVPKWKNVGGVQILIPLTADNAPAPPSGYTPKNYMIHLYDGVEIAQLNGVTTNGAPAFMPSFVLSEVDGMRTYRPIPVSTGLEPAEPITPVTGEDYVLTLKTSAPAIFTTEPVTLVVDLSNLEWVEYYIK